MSVSSHKLIPALRAICAIGLTLLALVAGAGERHPLASSLLAGTVFALTLVGYLAPRFGPRYSLYLGLGAILPLKWVAGSPAFGWEGWMDLMDLLPVWLLVVVSLFGIWRAVRRRCPPRVWHVPRLLVIASITLVATALPAWALSLALSSDTRVPFDPTSNAVGFAAWVLASGGLLRAGARLNGLHLSPAGKHLLTIGLATALAASVWCVYDERIEASEADLDLTPYAFAHQLRSNLEELYPHWDSASVTLEVLWDSHRERLVAEATACTSEGNDPGEPCVGLLRVMRDMFAELRNGHTSLSIDSDLSSLGLWLRPVSDGVVIGWVKEGSEAERTGLRLGMEVVAVDGLPVEVAAGRVPAWMTSGVSDRTRDYDSLLYVLAGDVGSSVTLTVEAADGSWRTAELMRNPVLDDEEDEESRIEGYLEDESFGYIALGGFEGDELVAKFDRQLDTMFETHGLILDLRDNGGGYPGIATEMLGRFFAEPVQLSELCERNVWEEWDGHPLVCEEQWLQPRAPVFLKPVAVLINEESASAAERVAYALCRVGSARCFGRTTAGESDTTLIADFPGGEVRISVEDCRPTVGPPILGAGVEPDEIVELTIADVRAGRDPTYEAARRWIEELRSSGRRTD